MKPIIIAGWLLMTAVTMPALPALSQNDGPILLPKKPAEKIVIQPAAATVKKPAGANVELNVDLACNWTLDGKSQGRFEAGGHWVKLDGGKHLLTFVTLDGQDKEEIVIDFKNDKELISNGAMRWTELKWARQARLDAQQEAKTGGQLLRTIQGQSGILSVAFSPNGRSLASGSDDYTNKLWDAASGQLLRTIQYENEEWEAPIFSNGYPFAFSPDGRFLASANWDNTIKLWDTANGQLLRTYKGDLEESPSSIAFSSDGGILVSWDTENPSDIRLWDVASAQLLHSLKYGEYSQFKSVAISPDGHILASGHRNGNIELWDVTSGQSVRSIGEHSTSDATSPDDHYIESIAFSPDGRFLVSGVAYEGAVKLWDTTNGLLLRTFHSQKQTGLAFTFSLDGRILALWGPNDPIRLWDMVSGELLSTLRYHSGDSISALSVVFSPDGRTLAATSPGFSITLWDVASGQLLRTLVGHSNEVNSVAFSPDGRTLASGSTDTTIKLWDVSNLRK